MSKKPRGFDEFDALMRKLVKLPPDAGKPTSCKHEDTRFIDAPGEPGSRSIEVCNLCGMSRRHWEQGESDWLLVDLEDFS